MHIPALLLPMQHIFFIILYTWFKSWAMQLPIHQFWLCLNCDHCPPQMLPLLKRTTDNLVAVVGEKAASQESFEVLRYNNSIITTLVTIVNTNYMHGLAVYYYYPYATGIKIHYTDTLIPTSWTIFKFM